MKLSENTVQVLKNFSGINQSLQFKSGNVLKTISPLKTIYVEATVTENFPKDFALYDLNKLLAKVSLYKDAELSFDDDKVNISANKKSDYIKYCSPKVIVAPQDGKSITLTDPDCSFNLSHEDLEWMKKSAGISGSPNFIFESDGSVINFIATDIKDDSADQSKVEIGTVSDGKKFRVVMKVENFKLLEGSYEVAIAKKGLAQFKHKEHAITYYIAIEAANSTFGDE
jgi:hypothetical protein